MTDEALLDPGTNSGRSVKTLALAPVAPLLLAPKEAAAVLRISPRLLWAKTKSGEVPCIRIGAAVRYSQKALQEWIDRMSAES